MVCKLKVSMFYFTKFFLMWSECCDLNSIEECAVGHTWWLISNKYFESVYIYRIFLQVWFIWGKTLPKFLINFIKKILASHLFWKMILELYNGFHSLIEIYCSMTRLRFNGAITWGWVWQGMTAVLYVTWSMWYMIYIVDYLK